MSDNFEPQQPCPSCGKPMDGLRWRNEDHECSAIGPLQCPHPKHWLGPYGNCRTCSTQQVAEAVQDLIADELERIADSYIRNGTRIDIWQWTGRLAHRVRAGEFTKPSVPEIPF